MSIDRPRTIAYNPEEERFALRRTEGQVDLPVRCPRGLIDGVYENSHTLVVLGVISVLLSGCNLEGHLIYYPGEVSIGEIHQYAADNDLQMWPARDETYQGIVSRKEATGSKGIVVVFHGNGAPAVFRTCYIAALEARGYRVVLAEYPGYGGRPGELSEKSLVADARRTALRAVQDFGGPLYVWGESMGCGVASALAGDPSFNPEG